MSTVDRRPHIHNSAGFKLKSLAQWVFEAGIDESNGPNYATAAATPSPLPLRHFCSVCGYWGRHACARCGMRYCCLKCQETHKVRFVCLFGDCLCGCVGVHAGALTCFPGPPQETRCLKFATG